VVIRRIREHVATHNWFAVAVDLAIVVAGVFLGTQANNWNEARIQRAAAADYRRQIIDDLKSNEVDLASRLTYYARARDHALAALEAIEGPGPPGGAQFLLDAYQASQVWLRPVIRIGYDEMTGAGLSHSIGDRATRRQLTAYYTQIRQFDVTATALTTYRERLRRAMPYRVQEEIKRQCPERLSTVGSGGQIATLPVGCKLALDPQLVAASLARLESANLSEDLTRHIADIDQKLAGFARFVGQARENRRMLEAQDRE
jgi:hypothetical protein